MSATQSQINYTQTMYIAYYGRPADPGGLQFWSDRLAVEGPSGIANAFGTSQEFVDNYGSLSPEALVNGLYLQLFGRDADPGGLAFYVGGLNRGEFTLPDIALRIIDGVQPGGGDDLIVANRLLVANYVTNDAPGTNLLTTILDRVTDDSASVDAALDALGIEPEDRRRFDLSIGDEEEKGGIAGSITAPSTAQTITSTDVINVDELRSDPRFSGIDGSGYTVVVLDTGIDLNHPAFGPDNNGDGISDRIIYAQDFTGEGDATPDDVNGHGTNVASIVGSSVAAYPGVAPGVNIVALQVLNNSGSGTSTSLERALQWVVNNQSQFNIVAINMSLGWDGNANNPEQRFVADELAALESLGVINIAAAGNNYFNYQFEGAGYPATDPNTIAVGAVWDSNVGSTIRWGSGATDFSTGTDRVTSFSQRSETITPIFAPGAFITGAAPGGGSEAQGGTSQAAPHIAGIAALAQQIADENLGRRLSPDEFLSLLVSSAVTIVDGDDEDDNVINSGSTYNRVDVLALAEAIVALDGGAQPPPDNSTDAVPGDPSTTASLAIGASLQGTIDSRGDTDWYRVALEAGATYEFTMNGVSLEDPWLALHAPNGVFLVSNNDSQGSLNSALTYVAPETGTYFLSAEAFSVSQTGSYTLEARSADVAFTDGIPGDLSTTTDLANGATLPSQIDFGGDQDWLRLSLQGGVTYTITVAGSTSGGGTLADPVLGVFDAAGTLVAVNDDDGPGLEPLLNFTPQTSGSYFAAIRAFGATDTGSYTAALDGDEDVDAIPGDSSTTFSLASGASTSSDIDFAGDEDWYAVNLVAGQEYVFSLNGTATDGLSDPFLTIYSDSGQPLATDDDGGEGLNARLAVVPESSGVVFVSAGAFGNAIGGYTLGLNTGDQSGSDSINGVGIGDAGNSRAAATTVSVAADGTASAAGFAGFAGDPVDYFAFTAGATGIAAFAMIGLGADLDIALEDASGTTIAGSFAGGSNDEQFTFTVQEGQTYYLRVNPYQTAASAYALGFSLPVSSAAGAPDSVNGQSIVDAGDTLESAYLLPGGTFLSIGGSAGFGGDTVDVYRIDAAGAGSLSAVMSGLRNDMDILLANADGTVLASSTNAGPADEAFDFPLSAGETYYLVVYPYAGESEYRLDLQLPGGGSGATDTVNGSPVGDAGDSLPAATAVTLDAAGDALITGAGGFGGDPADFYLIDARASGTAIFDLFGLGDDLDVAVFSTNGEVLAYEPFAGSTSEFLTVDLVAGQSYVVGVIPWEEARSDYTLIVNTDSVGSTPDIVNNVDIGDAGSAADPYVAAPDADGVITVDAAVGFGNDTRDAVRFTVGASGAVTIVLSDFEASADLDLILYDSAGDIVAFSALETPGATESLTYEVIAGETYTAEAVAWSGASTYAMDILTPAGPTGAADRVASVSIGDAPDDFASAFALTLDSLQSVFASGSVGVGADGFDFYSAIAAFTGTLTLGLSNLVDDIDLGLFDTSGNLLASSTAAGAADEQISFEATAGQQFIIGVVPYGAAQSEYALAVQMPTGAINEFIGGVDLGGDIGGIDNAYPMFLDSTGVGLLDGSLGFSGDQEDAVSFRINGRGTLQIELYNYREDADLDLYLYNSAGELVAFSESSIGGAREVISIDVQPDESYTAQVVAFSGASTYFLDVFGPTPAGDVINGFFVGDSGDRDAPITFNDAISFFVGSGETGGSDAEDAVTFTALNTGDVNFELLVGDGTADRDLDLYLLDSAGNVLALGEASGSANEQFNFALTAGEEYTVLVFPFAGSATYDLFVGV